MWLRAPGAATARPNKEGANALRHTLTSVGTRACTNLCVPPFFFFFFSLSSSRSSLPSLGCVSFLFVCLPVCRREGRNACHACVRVRACMVVLLACGGGVRTTVMKMQPLAWATAGTGAASCFRAWCVAERRHVHDGARLHGCWRHARAT